MSDLKQQLEAIIEPIAAKFETKPEHWIHDWDESFSFCYDCAAKKVAELKAAPEDPNADYMIDGGWGIEGDSMAFCETCHCPLDNSFTDYGCKSELDHFEEYGFELTPADCYSLDNILGAQLWEGGDLSDRIHALAEKIIAANPSSTGSGTWMQNYWTEFLRRRLC